MVTVAGEVLANQPIPVVEVHAVVLADAEALLLLGPDHVAHQVPQQAPFEQRFSQGLMRSW